MYTTLYGVSFTDPTNGCIVGEGGTILSTARPGSIVAVHEGEGSVMPTQFSLSQNYPNPFNPTTNFDFRLPARQAGIGNFSAKGGSASGGEFVKLAMFDILGREVATLVNEKLKPGKYTVRWDGSAFPSGVYFYRLTAGGFVDTKKMVLMK